MRKRILLAPLLGCTAISTTFAGTNEWTTAYAQGVEEHLIADSHGNELNISCPDDDESSVRAYASIKGKQYSSERDKGFDVIIDGISYSNPFFTDCHVCGANFPEFWMALRKAKKIQLSAGKEKVTLPTKNLQETLPALKSKENICRSAW
ncbi:hypothetical protein [Pseudomonas aeruginosa]|uniref:hypothetical protein n=1 Tax=Pseudomonas aeruginosa TaxID=287 RepID=UPI0038C58FC2|nr:hypothetical protein [Pseudomonas aeruginosa]